MPTLPSSLLWKQSRRRCRCCPFIQPCRSTRPFISVQCKCDHVTVREEKVCQCSAFTASSYAQARLRSLDIPDFPYLQVLGRSCALVCRRQVADNYTTQTLLQSCPRCEGPISWLESMLAKLVRCVQPANYLSPLTALTDVRRALPTPSGPTGAIRVLSTDGPAQSGSNEQTKSQPGSGTARPRATCATGASSVCSEQKTSTCASSSS
jgi:hypothetical protein